MRTLALVSLSAMLALDAGGCATTRRFADRRILWRDPDDLPTAQPPVRRNPLIRWEGTEDAVFRPADRFFGLDYGTEAVNVNALDEVPDSTWFVDRRRDPTAPDDQPRWIPLAPDVMEWGPVRKDDVPVPPFTIESGKTVGSAKGFVARDARGVKYLFKLDPVDYPQLVTSSEVVASRLAWALGWNVPANLLVDLDPATLSIAPSATTRDRYDRAIPFRAQDLDELVRPRLRDGRLRAMASRWIDGRILGWFSYLGRDEHDPNDRVPHEDRRDLRGFGVWAAWVDDVDTFENNTLDTYVGPPGAGHVVHYQQDVGASFGVFAALPNPVWMGAESYFSPGRIFGSALSLGAAPRPWYGRDEGERDRLLARWPELGYFDVEHFSPRGWQPVVENAAFARQTARDRYWGAKRILSLTDEELRAAIRAGWYRPEAAERLFTVLVGRRQKIAREFLAEVTPLDRLRLDGDQLCFEDLWIAAGLGGNGATLYEVREEALDGVARFSGSCVRLPAHAGYRIVELRARRPGEARFGKRPLRVHFIERAGGVRHILGIER
jgi:hypothetical protein